jgi:thiol-disulfide isomerase/thioredoxin
MRIAVILALLLCASSANAEDKPQPKKRDGPSAGALIWARETVAARLKVGEKAPEFAPDRDWLNVSRPLTLAEDLRGKVVILDFWCYCCINCLHVLPDLAYLEERYKDKPFAVVGVHSAKFTNEKDAANIRNAVLRHEIAHPVVNDADFAIWRSYGARSWPTFAVIAPDGTLIGTLSGEGKRDELDALVEATLEHFEQLAPKTLSTKPLPMRPETTTRPPGQLAYPGQLAVHAPTQSLFIADSGHHRIVEVGLDGTFKRAFGTGVRGLQDGPAEEARFHSPQGLAIHAAKLWVCDTENHALRTIDLDTGIVSTVAGTGAKGNHWKLLHPTQGVTVHGPWPAKTTALNSPWDILFLEGVGYIAMAGSHSLWTIDPKTNALAHFAGDLSERRLDAADPFKAAFAQPSGLATDGTSIFVADSESSAILMVSKAGVVETLAGATDEPTNLFHYGDEDGVGAGKRFQHPLAVAFHDGLVWVADSYNHKLKTLDPKTRAVRSRLGGGVAGHRDGTTEALLSEPSGLALAGTILYVADANNHVIRTLELSTKGSLGRVATMVLSGVPIPMAHARGGAGDTWPVFPGVVFPPAIDVHVAVGLAMPVELRLALPKGWKLTAGAPAVLRIEIPGDGLNPATVRDTAIQGLTTKAEIPAPTKTGEQQVKVRVLYYACQDDSGCRVRSLEYSLRLIVGDGHKVSSVALLKDLFVP